MSQQQLTYGGVPFVEPHLHCAVDGECVIAHNDPLAYQHAFDRATRDLERIMEASTSELLATHRECVRASGGPGAFMVIFDDYEALARGRAYRSAKTRRTWSWMRESDLVSPNLGFRSAFLWTLGAYDRDADTGAALVYLSTHLVDVTERAADVERAGRVVVISDRAGVPPLPLQPGCPMCGAGSLCVIDVARLLEAGRRAELPADDRDTTLAGLASVQATACTAVQAAACTETMQVDLGTAETRLSRAHLALAERGLGWVGISTSDKPLKTCGGCHWAQYCSREHQTQHWPHHKYACKHFAAVVTQKKCTLA
jgi:hypothetical protein